jgi:hypothetical protein
VTPVAILVMLFVGSIENGAESPDVQSMDTGPVLGGPVGLLLVTAIIALAGLCFSVLALLRRERLRRLTWAC